MNRRRFLQGALVSAAVAGLVLASFHIPADEPAPVRFDTEKTWAFTPAKDSFKDDALLDPNLEPARIRAFFVRPGWTRQGIGSLIMAACEAAARTEGFRRLELVATLAGEPLYLAHEFTAVETFEVALPNGAAIRVIRMVKELG